MEMKKARCEDGDGESEVEDGTSKLDEKNFLARKGQTALGWKGFSVMVGIAVFSRGGFLYNLVFWR